MELRTIRRTSSPTLRVVDSARRGPTPAHPRVPEGAELVVDGDVAGRYDAVFRRADPAEGERRLLLAVLEDGYRTLLKHAGATRGRAATLQREALGWLLSTDRLDVFAFETICETLGIDATRLRSRVLTEASMPSARAVG